MKKLDKALSEIPLGERAEMAMKEAVAEAIAEHHRAGRSVPIWRDGRVVMLPPEQSAVAEEESEYHGATDKDSTSTRGKQKK